MAPAPWEKIPSQDSLFVLVTGANSGVGFGICQRLINEFLTSRSLSCHLILFPTTRGANKAEETVAALRRYCRKTAETSRTLRSRAGPNYDPRDTTKRVHILSVQLDLCNLPSIRRAAQQLVGGTFSRACDDGFFEPLVDVQIPRMDAVIFNAGIGGWTGLHWGRVFRHFLIEGIVQAATWPDFKAATAGHVVNPISDSKDAVTSTASPVLGEVFCANVFGHYLLAHALLPLLNRPQDSPVAPGRIIWESSVEPVWKNFSLNDFQAVKTNAAYESSKRLTDILALTTNLPAARPYSSAYLRDPESPTATPPKVYLSHPGVVVTTLFPLNAFLFFWYRFAMYLARYLGSPWHPVTAYKGACAPVWLALQDQAELDALRADRVKWGTSTDWRGREAPKKTEVEGWGWEGRVEDREALAKDPAVGVQRKLVGRKRGAPDLTEEKRDEFEAIGAECWREMEKLRRDWEARLQ